jgi:hypothetical protein
MNVRLVQVIRTSVSIVGSEDTGRMIVVREQVTDGMEVTEEGATHVVCHQDGAGTDGIEAIVAVETEMVEMAETTEDQRS